MLLKLLLILEDVCYKNSCILLHTEMGLENKNRNISADVNDLVATRRFTLVLFTFPLGYDYHVSEDFSSSSLIRNIHARRCNLSGMKNKCLLVLLLSKGKLSYMRVAITSTFP